MGRATAGADRSRRRCDLQYCNTTKARLPGSNSPTIGGSWRKVDSAKKLSRNIERVPADATREAETDMLIAGDWAESRSGGNFEVTNPANGETITELPDGGREEAARAIDAA